METNTESNPVLKELAVRCISNRDARRITVTQHYMKTWPQGAVVSFGLFRGRRCVGVQVLGYSPTTERKVRKWCHVLDKKQFIELQRTWISDEIGHNAESWMMSRVMKALKKMGVWLVLTHSGGCKDDVGFIFQASGWMYFGGEKCDDFYETIKGEYKNLVSAMRFGRVPKDVMKQGKQAAGEFLFGPGKIVHARRHLYLYPINKGLRQRLKKKVVPFPKDPAVFRYRQSWHNETMDGGARGADGLGSVSGSTPDPSASHIR